MTSINEWGKAVERVANTFRDEKKQGEAQTSAKLFQELSDAAVTLTEHYARIKKHRGKHTVLNYRQLMQEDGFPFFFGREGDFTNYDAPEDVRSENARTPEDKKIRNLHFFSYDVPYSGTDVICTIVPDKLYLVGHIDEDGDVDFASLIIDEFAVDTLEEYSKVYTEDLPLEKVRVAVALSNNLAAQEQFALPVDFSKNTMPPPLTSLVNGSSYVYASSDYSKAFWVVGETLFAAPFHSEKDAPNGAMTVVFNTAEREAVNLRAADDLGLNNIASLLASRTHNNKMHKVVRRVPTDCREYALCDQPASTTELATTPFDLTQDRIIMLTTVGWPRRPLQDPAKYRDPFEGGRQPSSRYSIYN